MIFPLEGATWEKLILVWPKGDNLKPENKLEEINSNWEPVS